MLKTFPSLEAMDGYINNQIMGSFSIWDMKTLAMYTAKLQPGDKYLEIGTQFGKSISVAVFTSPVGVEFHTVDILDQSAYPTFHSVSRAEYFAQEELNSIVEYHLIDSKELAKTWDRGEFKMIFIDGNHDYEAVKADIVNWTPFLQHGGWILFHDYDITSMGVQQAVNELIKDSPDYQNFFYSQETYGFKSSIAGAQKK
jgi:predicted O-methyltransferase YrrM